VPGALSVSTRLDRIASHSAQTPRMAASVGCRVYSTFDLVDQHNDVNKLICRP